MGVQLSIPLIGGKPKGIVPGRYSCPCLVSLYCACHCPLCSCCYSCCTACTAWSCAWKVVLWCSSSGGSSSSGRIWHHVELPCLLQQLLLLQSLVLPDRLWCLLLHSRHPEPRRHHHAGWERSRHALSIVLHLYSLIGVVHARWYCEVVLAWHDVLPCHVVLPRHVGPYNRQALELLLLDVLRDRTPHAPQLSRLGHQLCSGVLC
mmetsp:Transcript_25486/g.55414  ORF Transcript_25486/g.55414 Transcript_25486/m.55414 type:complete len:205 (-) Transcript_25486:713-1327(-)